MELPESIIRSMHHNAKLLSHRFPMVQHDDLVQEMWLWALSHPRKVARYMGMEDERKGHGKLSWSLRNAALAHAHKEKARVTGYETDDLFFYSIKLLRDLLTVVYDEESWTKLAVKESSTPDGSKPTKGSVRDGMDAVASLIDVKHAVTQLSVGNRQLIEWVFRDGHSDEWLSVRLQVTEDAARMRVQRALRRLQEELGGERPDWSEAQRDHNEHAVPGVRVQHDGVRDDDERSDDE